MMGKKIPGKKFPSIRRLPCLPILITLAVLQIFLLHIFGNLTHPPRFSTPPWSHPLSLPGPTDPSSALLTPIPEVLPDGLGHRFAVINFELQLAQALSVRYIHRAAQYDSLTRHDPFAVDKLFGWYAIEETRDRILKHCVVERKPATGCAYRTTYPVCKSLKKGSPFKRLVDIPRHLVDCIPLRKPDCWRPIKEWAVGYGRETLFQMQYSQCHEDYRSGKFADTRAWFRNMYWDYHRVTRLIDSLKQRVTLDQRRFQIGVHIRRGDFLNDTTRVVIPDNIYADVVCQVKDAVDDVLAVDVPTDVHIFSEGIPKKDSLSRHDISLMKKMYVTEEGFAVKPVPHWTKVMRERCRSDVKVITHIATDTMRAIHDMIAADVFVGSSSGLSVHIVDVIARGVSIAPVWRGPVRMNGNWGLRYDHDRDNGRAILDRMELRRCLQEMKKDGRLRGIHLPR